MTIRDWWQTRLKREKITFAAGMLVLSCIVVYLCIEPMIEEKARLESLLPQMQNDLVWMQKNLVLLQQLRASGNGADVNEISAAMLERLVREAGLQESLSDLKPVDDNGVTVFFEEVSYAKLLDLLYQLRALKNALVSQAAIIAINDKPGKVRANLTLVSETK